MGAIDLRTHALRGPVPTIRDECPALVRLRNSEELRMRWRPTGTSENHAIEDAHDHAWPGWRDLPTVPRIPESGTTKRDRDRAAKWIETVNTAYPDGWLEAGGPIRTDRIAPGRRHVPARTPFGGYDLAVVT